MTNTSTSATFYVTPIRRSEGWFYVAMAIVAMGLTIIGFGPALVDTASRKAPLTLSRLDEDSVLECCLCRR